jgi:parvulin-like peptidyl-prolyl isomerase
MRANTRTEARSPRSVRPSSDRRAARAAALLAAGLLALAVPCRAAILEEIVAKVNNRIITKSEFEERSQYILRQISQQHSGPDLDRSIREAQDTMLANMITELLLIERADTLLDMDKVRKNLIDDFRKQQKIDSEDALDKMLKEQSMTRRDLEEQLIRLAVPQEVINYEVRRKISVGEREIEEHYEKHIKDYETPPTVTLREIVLFYEPATREEVRLRAEAAVREFRGGASFVDLVQRYSAAGTKEAGGLLDPLSAADLQSEIALAAFALRVGDVSPPIDTGKSFHVVRLEARTDRVVKPLAQVHDTIYDALRDEKYKPRYDAYLRRIWQDGHIEITPKYERLLVVSPLKPKPDA